MRLSREIKNKIKKATEEIIYEEKKKQELLNTEIDYNFLQLLINKTNANPDLVIDIAFKSGDKMRLFTQYKNTSPAYDDYDGEPADNELEIK